MQTKKISYWWSVLIGLVFPVLQIAVYYLRFNELNPYAPLLDYLWFYLAGVAGVLLLIFLLNRSRTGIQKWLVVITFLVATPISTSVMVGGGAFGPIGIILAPLFIWTLFSGFGFLVGRFFSRKLLESA